MSCLVAKAVLGVGLGMLLRADPLAAPLGVGFAEIAPAAAAAVPFNGGTGFFVSADGAFVAPHHVMGDCPRPALQTPSGLVVGKRVAGSAALDIAVARSAVNTGFFARFAEQSHVKPGQPLAVVRYRGCGGLESRSINEAQGVPLAPRLADRFALAAASPIEGGNSGSAVVDEAGRVLGMVVARAAIEARTGFAVDGEALKGFLIGAGIDIDIVPERLPLGSGLAGAAAAQYTFPLLCLY